MTEQTEPRLGMVQFRPGALAEELQTRPGSPGIVAKRDLDRYYALLRYEVRRLILQEPELFIIADALRDNHYGPALDPQHWLAARVEDGIRFQLLDKKYGWQGGMMLVAKCRNYTPGEALAIIDGVERAWGLTPAGESVRAALSALRLLR